MHKEVKLSSEHKSFNCYSGSVCYVLSNQGIVLSEAMGMGLSAGLGFQMTLEPEFQFRCIREEHCLTECLLKMGVCIELFRVSDFQWFLNFIYNNIDKKIPVMIGYDGFYFPFAKSYGKEHESRIGVITGYHEGGVYFTDLVFNVTNYEIPYDRLKSALFNYSDSEELIHFFWITYPPDVGKLVTKEAVKEAMISLTESYCNEKGDEKLLKGAEGLKTYVNNFLEILFKIVGVEDWNGVLVDLKQMALVLKLYEQFISETVALLVWPFGNDAAEELKNSFAAASLHWGTMCNAICRYKLTQKKEEMVLQPLEKFQVEMDKIFKILILEIAIYKYHLEEQALLNE